MKVLEIKYEVEEILLNSVTDRNTTLFVWMMAFVIYLLLSYLKEIW